MMEENSYNIEELIHKALDQKSKNSMQKGQSSQCLSNHTIRQLYEGALSESERERALSHLDRCQHCMAELAAYAELVSPQYGYDTLAKLKQLQALVPVLKEKLHYLDFTAFCRKLSELTKFISREIDLQKVNLSVESLWLALEPKLSQNIVHARGKTTIPSEQPSFTQIKRMAKELDEVVDSHVATARSYTQQQYKWTGIPELWLLGYLSQHMKSRAVRVRDWCEEKLEGIGSHQELKYLPSLGITHCKRKLFYIMQVLKAFEQDLANPGNCFVIYTAAYCLHLGLLALKYKPIIASTESIWEKHSQYTPKIILGDNEWDLAPAWPVMGFSSQQEAALVLRICIGFQQQTDIIMSETPETQSMFTDGKTLQIQPLAVLAVLKLAEILECNYRRLPEAGLLMQKGIPKKLVIEYVKHEIVQRIDINKQGQIKIFMRSQYQYPDRLGDVHESVQDNLQQQINQVRQILSSVGLALPEPLFEHEKAMFSVPHPYLQ